MNTDIFDIIDTDEKAYWLGVLYADGNIKKNQVSLSQSIKRIELIFDFCMFIGVDTSLIKIINQELNWVDSKGKSRLSKSAMSCVTLTSNKLFESLTKHGCTIKKSKIIQFPFNSLNSENLRLSFLLGYYDGDGYTNSPVICSGSCQFLQEIKDNWLLPFNINYSKNHLGSCYFLTLGMPLFNKMLDNYPNSLLCKRGKKFLKNNFCIVCGKQMTSKSKTCRKCTPHRLVNKNRINKEELEQLVSNKSLLEVGKIIGMTDNGVRKRCKSLGIVIPTRGVGYWAKNRKSEIYSYSNERIEELLKTESIHSLASKFHTGHKELKKFIIERNITIPDINWTQIRSIELWEKRRSSNNLNIMGNQGRAPCSTDYADLPQSRTE